MIRPHRTIHRYLWLVLTPLLIGVLVVFSQPHTDLSPPNPALAQLPTGGKGALPKKSLMPPPEPSFKATSP